MRKGSHHTTETIKKLSLLRKEQGSPWMKGRKFTEEHRRNLSLSHSEEKGSKWKGDNVGFDALHAWVAKHLGKPSKCEHCGITTANKYEWANKSHEYKRELYDWIPLCKKCHTQYDDSLTKAWITRRQYGRI